MDAKLQNDKWLLVAEKIEELKKLAKQHWNNQEWELAALCESVIRTSDQSKDLFSALKADWEMASSFKGNVTTEQVKDICLTLNRVNRVFDQHMEWVNDSLYQTLSITER